jgi:hypothetical protein
MRHMTTMLAPVLFLSTLGTPFAAHALNVETHALVNEAASGTPTFNLFLQETFGFLKGLNEPFNDKSAYAWIAEGGIREDDAARFFRHFHDPLKPWNEAGYKHFESSVRWMQRTDQQWSWQAARDYYHTALTSVFPDVREPSWANTFRSLGQIMHLVVDASVPEHTRNDGHPLEGICRSVGLRCYGNYEYWVSDVQADNVDRLRREYLADPVGFDAGILLQPTGDAVARVPIARLIDTDTYTGADPNVTLRPAIGIAEISNANFFSEDTGDRTYPFPSYASLAPIQLPSPKTGRLRPYFEKRNGYGIPVSPALAQCVLLQATDAEGVTQSITRSCTDENVWQATARLMLPRAVGYARGVLNYFFRGQLEIAPPDRFVYGLAAFLPGNAGSFTSLRFKVRNATPGEDTGPGRLTAVVRYRRPFFEFGNLIDNPFAPIADQQFFAVSTPLFVTLSSTFQEFVFDFPVAPLPTNSADLLLTVVYRGGLGQEDDAVLVGSKDLFEPDPLDSVNLTDYDCDRGTPVYVVDLPAFDPPAHVERDPSGDGIQDLFGPGIERDHFVKTFALTQATPAPSEASFDFRVPELPYAQYARFLLLQDQPAYGVAFVDRQILDVPTGLTVSDSGGAVAMAGVVNDFVVDQAGRIVRRVQSSGPFRGVQSFHGIFLANQNMGPCFPQAPFLPPPPMTRVDGLLPAR